MYSQIKCFFFILSKWSVFLLSGLTDHWLKSVGKKISFVLWCMSTDLCNGMASCCVDWADRGQEESLIFSADAFA
jgi:hypothetical protein